MKLKPRIPKIDADVKALGVLMLPGLMSAGIQQLNLLVGGWVASFQEGAKTLIYYADRIHQLPLGLIGIAFGVVLLPEISRKIRSKDESGASESMQQGLTLAMLIAIPAMVGMAVLAEQIIYALFEGGKFEAQHASLTSQALFAFSLGCPAYIITRVLQPGYFAREDTKTPMKYTVVTAVVNIFLCALVYISLHEQAWLHVGCAAATTIAGWLNVFLLISGLKRRKYFHLTGEFWQRLIKMTIAALLMGAVVYGLAIVADPWIYSAQKIVRLIVVGSIGSIGVLVYFGVAHITKSMTFDELKRGFIDR